MKVKKENNKNLQLHGVATVMSMLIFNFASKSVSGVNLNKNLESNQYLVSEYTSHRIAIQQHTDTEINKAAH